MMIFVPLNVDLDAAPPAHRAIEACRRDLSDTARKARQFGLALVLLAAAAVVIGHAEPGNAHLHRALIVVMVCVAVFELLLYTLGRSLWHACETLRSVTPAGDAALAALALRSPEVTHYLGLVRLQGRACIMAELRAVEARIDALPPPGVAATAAAGAAHPTPEPNCSQEQ